MNTSLTLVLGRPQSLIVLALCMWLIVRGRPQIVLGIYLALMIWTRVIVIFGVAHTWILLAVLVIASIKYLYENPSEIRFPPYDRWIAILFIMWFFWFFFLVFLFRPYVATNITRNWLLICLLPMPFLAIFIKDAQQAKLLALSFVITKLSTEVLYLVSTDITLQEILSDPTFGGWGAARFGIINYHWWGIGFALSSIFIFALFIMEKKPSIRFIYALLFMLSVWLLILSRSRQSIIGIMVALSIFSIWILRSRDIQLKKYIYTIIPVLVVVIALLYVRSPNLFLRAYDSGQSVTVSSAMEKSTGVRMGLWSLGWEFFVESPIWGTGFVNTVLPHNFLIGTLADQGIMGFLFLIGFLVFTLKQSSHTIISRDRDELTIWRMCWTCIVVFILVRGQASGAVYSLWDLYWAAAILWSTRRPPPMAEDVWVHSHRYLPRHAGGLADFRAARLRTSLNSRSRE